ncbi:hypothetical protein K9L67_02530 [Candidatus Woesearchaeota archaeon]|nr:hypothetical protein [Candidatus Woesearchaeota archaeon]MCF7901081.1 hypothetical protein [Candidatus Woesearchaeota archaeon]MCF8013136.1 hypothetical protein [Candidatus Woesearchaeota archaeon]
MKQKTNISIILIILIITILAILFLNKKEIQINSYKECVDAGNDIMESNPRQCMTKEGQIFIEIKDIGAKEKPASLCVNTCGNTKCEEIVCMGEGCPCAETPDSCPQDCQ